MPKPKKGRRYGGSAKHHNMMMANLATELFRHGRIRTTKAKAKTVQPVAERMITFARRGDLHARRQVLTVIRDKDVVHKLFADIGPAAANRNGGYTRVIPIGPRKGDNAEMAVIELVDIATSDTDLTKAPARRWAVRRAHGTLSTSAREREEAILAAEDAGADTYVMDTAQPADAVPAGSLSSDEDESMPVSSITERSLPREEEEDEREAPEVSPEDVESRLAEGDEEVNDESEDESAETTLEDVADPADVQDDTGLNPEGASGAEEAIAAENADDSDPSDPSKPH